MMNLESTIDQTLLSLGFSSVKKEQKEAIFHFAQGSDVFVALPTGYGKSLIYACLPRLYDNLRGHSDPKCIIIVISPLKALMDDQCRSFNELGLTAGRVSNKEIPLDYFLMGKLQIVLVSPESLVGSGYWREVIKSPIYQERLVGLIFDEAHLIKNW